MTDDHALRLAAPGECRFLSAPREAGESFWPLKEGWLPFATKIEGKAHSENPEERDEVSVACHRIY